MSSVKLGLVVAWPAFWTGVPVKIVLVLLLLAMDLHPWEMPGLAFLLLLSIPIDIWALTLSARTVFLERLRVQPPAWLGLTLWWQTALFSAAYLPAAYFIESQTVAGAKAVAARIMELELMMNLPVAERIGIELSFWGSVATVVLLALALGWLFVFGRLVRTQTAAASQADAPYQTLVRQWDLLRVPADQPLLLTVFTATGVVLVLLLWAFMPVTTPRPHEDYKQPAKVELPFRPSEALQKTEKVIAQAEAAVQALEAEAKEEAKGKSKGKEKGKDKDKGKGAGKGTDGPKAQFATGGAKAVKAEMASGKAESHADDGHTH